jgi:hypothetical protein
LSLSQDIGAILNSWEFDPERINVRVIRGDDGSDKIQMRIDLGLRQMEMAGRPDGQKPFGSESLLDYYAALATEARAGGGKFTLDSKACEELMIEGIQYYHRYLCAYHLELYDLVARDTSRNLRLFAFVARHAERESDKLEFEQYRPYVEMMYARAVGSQALKEGDHSRALAAIDEGVEAIRRFLHEYNQEDRESRCSELRSLLKWRREVETGRPVTPVERLKRKLGEALKLEAYEDAARIRDQIRRLTDGPSSQARGEFST